METTVQLHPLTVSHVIVFGQMPAQMNIDPNQLRQVFGPLGMANVIRMPDGFASIVGDSNQLTMQGNKVTFKGANSEILVDLYRNARPLIIGQVPQVNATAIGYNFEYDIQFPGFSATRVFSTISGNRLPQNLALTKISTVQGATTIKMETSTRDHDRVFAHVNNHDGDPQSPPLTVEQMQQDLEQHRIENEAIFQEIFQCLQPVN